jgi:hypothetical protein
MEVIVWLGKPHYSSLIRVLVHSVLYSQVRASWAIGQSSLGKLVSGSVLRMSMHVMVFLL